MGGQLLKISFKDFINIIKAGIWQKVSDTA